MKKQTLIVVMMMAILLIVSMLSACQKDNSTDAAVATDKPVEATQAPAEAAEPTEEPVEDVTITMWHNFGADTETPFFADTIIFKFQEANPHITVDVVAQGNDQYRELLITNIAAGTTPDIARIDGTHMAGFAKEDALVALEGLDGFDIVKDALFEGCVSSCIYKGSYYGLPLGTNCKTAVVDMDVMAELGFDAPPKTMEEFAEAAKANKAGEYMISVSSVGAWDILPYFWLFGGDLTDEGFTKADGFVNGQASIDAVTALVALHEDKVLTIKEIDGSLDAWDGIRENAYAMFFEGPWFFTYVPEYKDNNIVAATIPTYNGKSASIIGGESIVMFDTCQNTAAAFEFMKYLVAEDTQVEMVKGIGAIPVNMAAAKNEYIQSNDILKVYVEQLETAKARIPSPESSKIEEAIKDQFTLIFTKEVSVEDGLNELATILDEILAGQ